MVRVVDVDRWEDPCPFWDDDGQAYLVHSVLGAGPLVLHKMSADGRRLLDEGRVIYRGSVAEGPKFYKRNGWYYISLPEGSVERGGQTVLRARNIYGPYERREVLPPGSPHQGGIVNAISGGFQCPIHGATFDQTGNWIGGQRTSNLRSYATSYDSASGVLTIG